MLYLWMVFCGFMGFTKIHGQKQCNKIGKSDLFCEKESTEAVLSCPAGNVISVTDSAIYRSNDNNCITNKFGQCKMGNVLEFVKEKCEGESHCRLYLDGARGDLKTCSSDEGPYSLYVGYSCQIVNVPEFSMCANDWAKSTSTQIYGFFHERDICSCWVKYRNDAQIQYYATEIDDGGTRSCDYYLTIKVSGTTRDTGYLCRTTAQKSYGCNGESSQETRNFTILQKSDSLYEGSFRLKIQASPDSEMSIFCGTDTYIQDAKDGKIDKPLTIRPGTTTTEMKTTMMTSLTSTTSKGTTSGQFTVQQNNFTEGGSVKETKLTTSLLLPSFSFAGEDQTVESYTEAGKTVTTPIVTQEATKSQSSSYLSSSAPPVTTTIPTKTKPTNKYSTEQIISTSTDSISSSLSPLSTAGQVVSDTLPSLNISTVRTTGIEENTANIPYSEKQTDERKMPIGVIVGIGSAAGFIVISILILLAVKSMRSERMKEHPKNSRHVPSLYDEPNEDYMSINETEHYYGSGMVPSSMDVNSSRYPTNFIPRPVQYDEKFAKDSLQENLQINPMFRDEFNY